MCEKHLRTNVIQQKFPFHFYFIYVENENDFGLANAHLPFIW